MKILLGLVVLTLLISNIMADESMRDKEMIVDQINIFKEMAYRAEKQQGTKSFQKPCGIQMDTMSFPCEYKVVTIWTPCGFQVNTTWFPCENNVESMWKSCSVHMETIWCPPQNLVVFT